MGLYILKLIQNGQTVFAPLVLPFELDKNAEVSLGTTNWLRPLSDDFDRKVTQQEVQEKIKELQQQVQYETKVDKAKTLKDLL